MKLVKLFNKLSAVALAASLVVGFASCSTTTDDPFNPNAPLTLEEYVKSEIKKAIENGGAPAKPEDPSELEFESRTSLMDKIQLNNEKTEDAWGNGTKISSANPLQASEGYGWDKENGQISLPFAYDAGYFGENTHIIIEADDSALNYNADAAIKIEFKVENPSTKHSNEMNITSKFKDGVAIIPISEIGFTDSCQFLLTFRAKGTVTIKNIDMAKAKGQSAPEPTPGEEQKPDEKPEPEDSGLLSKAADLSWGTPVSVAGSSFESATDNSSIKITYVSNKDTAQYYKFKMMCGDGNVNELFAGEATGFTIDTESESPDNLHGCDFAAAPSETPAVITYKPSTEEWAKIKAGEFRLIGNGAKITKIELEAAAGGENNAGGEGDNGAGDELVAEPFVVAWSDEPLIAGSNFKNANDNSKIVFKYVGYGDLEAPEYYCKFKLIAGGWAAKYGAGAIEGATIANNNDPSDDDGYMAIEPTAAPADTTTEYTITYSPTASEWATIKEKGLVVAGNGAKVISVKFIEGAAAGGGGGEEDGDSVVFDDAISAVELSPNNWNKKDNGIQYHVANASLFPDGIEAGDKYKFEMTGSVTGGPITQKFIIVIDNDTYNPNNVQNYFVNDPSVSGKSAEECLSEGITVTMTFDAAIESSKVVLWIYTEGPGTDYDAETTASKTATIDFSSFKITKVE